MIDGLPGIRTRVHHEPIPALGEAFTNGYLRGDAHHRLPQALIGRGDSVGNVPSRYYENMRWCLRIDIAKRNEVGVASHYACRDYAIGDAAKQTVGANRILLHLSHSSRLSRFILRPTRRTAMPCPGPRYRPGQLHRVVPHRVGFVDDVGCDDLNLMPMAPI